MKDKPYLSIISAGLCTPVGTDLFSATAAIRAGLDHFRETHFRDTLNHPIIGSLLYDCQIWGPARFIALINDVIEQSLKTITVDKEHIVVCLLLPEEDRPGMFPQWLKMISETVLQPFHTNSIAFNRGKAGIGEALPFVQEILSTQTADVALLIGCDSYFNAETIRHYMDTHRLLHSENRDGFIPGEGAASVALTLADNRHSYVNILGFDTQLEAAHILQTKLPLRVKSLSEAIEHACQGSYLSLSDTQFHISDANGESFYFKEISLATTRTLKEKVAHYPHYLIAKSLGETGAASSVMMLATLFEWMKHPEGPGDSGLVISSADSGERTAIILQYQEVK
ncbi:3-oxoacyl-ACP synthase [Providencia sp. PROV221]|uniref:3-oxoacyl-ACP synthase n=1 Tax=Providencia sp. PROV221 TaxID=2949916 RepID=UPI00234A4A39|nr:3-oxoacyl-ACP synthase [Providencia sp. PROV221]